jgi:hypothetical protein
MVEIMKHREGKETGIEKQVDTGIRSDALRKAHFETDNSMPTR